MVMQNMKGAEDTRNNLEGSSAGTTAMNKDVTVHPKEFSDGM